MSVFGPNQVGEIIVGKTYAAEADIPDFIANAVAGDIQVLSLDSSAVAAGKTFKVLQKSDVADGGIEFTEGIVPGNVEYIKAEKHLAPTLRQLKVSGFSGTIRANATYEVFIRHYNVGSNSVENFEMIPAFYVTGSDVTGETWAGILTSLKADLDASIARQSLTGELTITTDPDELFVTGGNRKFKLGVKDGKATEFDLHVVVYAANERHADLLVETVAAGNPGLGTGHQTAKLEWFLKGDKYSRYREIGYPANFSTPYEVIPGNTYHLVTIGYYLPRTQTNVERQYRLLYCAVENADQDAGGGGTEFTAVNALIADLETATGLTIGALS